MSGFLTRAALALEAFGTSPVWPAASPVAVTTLLPTLSENVRDVPVAEAIARTHPRSGPESRTRTAVRVEGPLQLQAAYDGLSAVWAWALGLQHTSRPTELVEGAYQHLYELDPVAHSHPWPFGAFDAGDIKFNQQLVRRATLAVERTTSVWEHLSTMVRSLTVNASPNGVSLALNLVGHSTDRASATNTTAVLAALSEPDWQWVQFHQLEARLAPFSASTALDSDDAISLMNFRLDVSHHLKTRQRRDTGLYIGEPRRDQLPEVKGSLTLPYYDSDTLIGWALAQTVLMAELRFTGAAIGATGYDYQLAFWLPALQLEAPEAGTQGPADREQSFNFRALVTETDPAGFPAFALSGPLYVELVNDDSINVLTGDDQAGEGGGEEELGGVTDGLQFWLKADDLAGTYNDNDPVDTWTDASPNAVAMTAADTARPLYKTAVLNGHDVVRFDGVNDGMSGTNPMQEVTTGFTMFAVTTNVVTETFGIIMGTDMSGNRGPVLFYASSLSGAAWLHGKDHTDGRQGATSILPGPSLLTGRYDGSGTPSLDLYLDGVLDNGSGSGFESSFTNDTTSISVGWHNFGNFMQGDIAEVAWYNRALTAQERAAVEAALMTKYGLS